MILENNAPITPLYIPLSTRARDRVFPLQARKLSRKYNLPGEDTCRTEKKLGLSVQKTASQGDKSQLDIYRMPFGVMGGFHQDFAQSRMRMHVARDFLGGKLHHLRNRQLG